jgi:hypothetical protein
MNTRQRARKRLVTRREAEPSRFGKLVTVLLAPLYRKGGCGGKNSSAALLERSPAFSSEGRVD